MTTATVKTAETIETTETIWINEDGMTTCMAHAGHYLRTAVAARPRSKRHFTPLDDWCAVTAADQAILKQEGEDPVTCETCTWG